MHTPSTSRTAPHADTEKHFKREAINLQTNRKVMAVTPGAVKVMAVDTKQEQELPFGLCVWSTGTWMYRRHLSLYLSVYFCVSVCCLGW